MSQYSWPDPSTRPLLGKNISRVDGPSKASGRAKYTYDYNPQGLLAARKAKLTPYPDALAAALIARFIQEAQFFLAIADKAANKGDLIYVTGCAYRVAACLLQVVFAQNRQWLLNEKGAVALAATFAKAPADLKPRLESAFSGLSPEPQSLRACLDTLTALTGELAA